MREEGLTTNREPRMKEIQRQTENFQDSTFGSDSGKRTRVGKLVQSESRLATERMPPHIIYFVNHKRIPSRKRTNCDRSRFVEFTYVYPKLLLKGCTCRHIVLEAVKGDDMRSLLKCGGIEWDNDICS